MLFLIFLFFFDQLGSVLKQGHGKLEYIIAFLLVGSLNFVNIRICLSRAIFLLIFLFIFAASAFLFVPGQVHGTGELYYSNESVILCHDNWF